MSRFAVLVVLVALVGCSAPPAKTPAAVAEADESSTFSPDQDVPLVAPDEAEAAKASPRLTETKHIGGGPDDTSVDGKHRGATTQASVRSTSTPRTTAPRTRGYYSSRGAGTYSSSSTTSSSTGGVPAVGASYPSAPSFGSPAAR